MIGRLTGTVLAEETDGALVLDVNGVGYELFAPLGTRGKLGDTSGPVTLYIHTHVREDAFTLFAFASDVDRTAFRTLIGVSGVGPRTAVAILGELPGAELARAIAEKNLGRLTSISGIGKKTAERLLLELRDKLPVTGDAGSPIAPAAAAPTSSSTKIKRSPRAERLSTALVNMGYKPAEADRAIGVLGDRVESSELPVLIRESLALLAK